MKKCIDFTGDLFFGMATLSNEVNIGWEEFKIYAATLKDLNIPITWYTKNPEWKPKIINYMKKRLVLEKI